MAKPRKQDKSQEDREAIRLRPWREEAPACVRTDARECQAAQRGVEADAHGSIGALFAAALACVVGRLLLHDLERLLERLLGERELLDRRLLLFERPVHLGLRAPRRASSMPDATPVRSPRARVRFIISMPFSRSAR